MKRIIVLIILIFCFSVTASAEDNDFYNDARQLSGFDSVADSLPDEVQRLFRENGIDTQNFNWVENLDSGNLFKMIWSFISTGGKTPFLALAELLAIIIIYATVNAFTDEKGGLAPTLSYIFSVIIALALIKNIIGSINGCVSAVSGTGVFMLSFVPVYAGIITVGGAPATAVSSSALLLGAAELVVSACAFLIVPLMSAYLGLGVATGMSPLIKDSGVADAVKKVAMWILSFCFTLFLGLLSMQTAIGTSADSMSVKTAKFMVGSFVPVVGSSLSEALTTVIGSVAVLKNSVGIYAVIAILALLLPVVIELLLWRLCIMVCIMASGMFSLPKIPQILKAVDSVFALLIGIILFVGALFIIALALVARAGG